MNIERYRPAARLSPFVKEFFIIESDGMMDSKILPDTSLVMALRYKGSTQRIPAPANGEKLAGGEVSGVAAGEASSLAAIEGSTLSAGEGSALAAVDGVVPLPPLTGTAVDPGVLTGLRRSHRIMRYSRDTGNILVLFREGGLAAFSRVPANELFDLTTSADNFFSKTAVRDLLGTLAEARDNEGRIRTIEAFLTQQLRGIGPDPLVDEAVRLIKESRGLIKIKDLAHALYISQDPLEKRFRAKVGSTPKQYASIIRLRNIIDTWSSYSSLTTASYEAGYFDQSHFIKDFRTFTGESPKDFFRTAKFW
ncbi:MAG: helix-turn-helix transcriptional regulator [Bacteroidetes bacterium]|nr:helix-turn-helix transcriptional regulator [Bacteroidota bacterium]